MILAAAALFLAAANEPAISPDLKELMTELAAAAYTTGACENHMPQSYADDMLAMFRNFDGQPGESDIEAFFVPILLNSYAEGRADSRTLNLTAAGCTRLIRKQGDLLDRAASKLKAPIR